LITDNGGQQPQKILEHNDRPRRNAKEFVKQRHEMRIKGSAEEGEVLGLSGQYLGRPGMIVQAVENVVP
jgi:hypothetical protein